MFMETTTKTFDNMLASELREQYDTQCKLLLSEKPILARIMKECVEEYKDCTIEQIESYIEGRPDISKIAVHSSSIHGMNTEDKTLSEGTIYYDIKFSAIVPTTKEPIELIINIEAQNKYNPGYPLVKRGVYYASRLISAQFGQEFDKTEYGNLKKVYSIWICMNPPKDVRNTIIEFNLALGIKVGREKTEAIEKAFEKKNYDLMSIIFVNLDKNETGASNLLELLTLIFHGEMKAIEKCKALETKFGMTMYQEISEEVAHMCDLSYGVWERGLAQGINQGFSQGIAQGISQGISQGIAQGINQGIAQGRTLAIKENAKNALKLGLPIEQIALITGLSKEEIASL